MNPGRLIWLAAAITAGAVLLCSAGLSSCAPLTGLLAHECHPEHVDDLAEIDECVPGLAAWDPDQISNAALIIEVGIDMDIPVWGQVIALAVAMQESSLRNLPHLGPGNDHDSVGLFQQRPSQGWGTPTRLMDPTYAAQQFYQALLQVQDWQRMPLTQAAQAVQRSAHPDAYAAWTHEASVLVATLSPAAAGGWTQPVHAPIVSGFRSLTRPDHNGVDLAAPRGTPIVAAAPGEVDTVACQARHVDGSWWGCDRDGHIEHTTGCGWYVEITHPGNITTRYCHLNDQPWVEQGEHVIAGQPIGLVGSTGRSSGPHLHFETHTPHTGGGRPVPTDPVAFMQHRGAPLGR